MRRMRGCILRGAFRQCLVGAASIVLLQYLLRLDLSRSFVGLFAVWSWVLLGHCSG